MADKVPGAAGNGPMLVKPATWEALRQRVEDLEIIPDPKDFSISTRGGKKLIRLRGVPGAVRPGPPPIPALTLSAGATGARIYKGVLEWSVSTLRFETKRIEDADGKFLEEVNSLSGQDAIAGVQVMERGDGSSGETPEESSAGDDDDWWPLTWWGQVWAKVVLNPETGEPVSWDIVGPDQPQMRAIPALDADLSRGSDGGGSAGEETGYAILIGTVPELGRIIQERTGNLEWFCAFVPENADDSSSDSSGSSSGSDSSDSSGGSSDGSGGSSDGSGAGSGSGSSKDTAIVPTPHGFRKWYAMEAAEVMFFDFAEITARRGITTYQIDPIVSFCMEKGSVRAFVSAERGSATASVQGDTVRLRASHFPWPATQRVQLMLCGIRRGFAGVRNGFATFADFVDNECRLNPRLTRQQVLAELAKRGFTA